MKFRYFIVLLIILAQTTVSFSQKSKKKKQEEAEKPTPSFTFGINVGPYFASKHTANFYNGSPYNLNTIDLITNNYYYMQDVYRAYGDTVSLWGLPQNMKYTSAIMAGIYFESSIGRTGALFIQFNFTKLTSKDVVIFKLGNVSTSYANPDLIECPIWGKETRMNIDIGMTKRIPIIDKIDYYVGGGVNFNNTLVKENKIYLGNVEYSLVNTYGNQPYIPNTNMQTYDVREGGIGFGAFLETGFKFKFGDLISVDPGVDIYWTKINFEGYKAFKPQFFPYIRFCFNRFASVSKD
jgi:hypothetical protein